ncbi:hypothetical protein AVEN_114356-1 [Araneus ventricosus]|uniref:Uncharacterized protein n=1 Tax=Araneus ventricosus TaxID=182803 RepID=A0A4Y2M2J2_ARAVE|nr:hypothetical protein AVEN_114356-1 [Araneus ventricosus]
MSVRLFLHVYANSITEDEMFPWFLHPIYRTKTSTDREIYPPMGVVEPDTSSSGMKDITTPRYPGDAVSFSTRPPLELLLFPFFLVPSTASEEQKGALQEKLLPLLISHGHQNIPCA